MGTLAIVAALERRDRTGDGDVIDLSQIEMLTTFIAGELVQAQVTGADPERRGNDPPRAVPARACTRASPTAIWSRSPCADDDDWQRLCRGDRPARPRR